MEVKFPIGLLLLDCLEVDPYESYSELADDLEMIDVENQEYAGWDADSFVIALWVANREGGSNWLGIRRISSTPNPGAFERAVCRDLDLTEGLGITPEPGEAPISLLRRIDDAIAVANRSWRRWRKRRR